MATELPPEITCEELGPEHFRFVFPRRDLRWVRLLGLPLVLGGMFYLGWIVRNTIQSLVRLQQPFGWDDAIFVVLGLFMGAIAYVPVGLGLAILFGRRIVELRGGKLRTTERALCFWRTKRWPIAKIETLQIVGFFPVPAGGHPPDSLVGKLDALTGLFSNGKRFMVVPGYPRTLLVPFAEQLAKLCDASFAGEKPRPAVQLETLVPARSAGDELEENDDHADENPIFPAGTRITLDRFPEGLTLTIPPTGIRGSSLTFVFVGALVTLLMGTIAVLAQQADTTVYGFLALFGLVGVLVLLEGIRLGRRSAAIAIAGRQLMVVQTGLLRSRTSEWDAAELEAIRIGPSGIEINEQPVLELQIIPATGMKFGMLAGRDRYELRWIAAVLRKQLQLPALMSEQEE